MSTNKKQATIPAPDPVFFYEVTATSPLKVGGVLAYPTARVSLTKAKADSINEAQPGSLRFLGV